MTKAKKQMTTDRLSGWEWTTLVAAWRYYEHGHTIASAMFPHDIVERFWGDGNLYTDNVHDAIANQFAYVDHGLNGEGDWTRWLSDRAKKNHLEDCDCAAWTTFYAFCKGWCDGFATITASNGERTETVKAFYTDYTRKWTPVGYYIKNPLYPTSIPDKYIKEKKR